MSARAEILGRLRDRAREAELPPVWQSKRAFEDLAVRFADSLTAVKGEVRRVENLDRAWQEVGQILEEVGAKAVVANQEWQDEDITRLRPDCKWFLVGHTEGDLRSFCAAADVGLSGAEAALAETGSIVVESGPGKSRLATLLPPVHVALVSASSLVPDIFTWTAARSGQMPANVVLISGPSKTADIEFTLTIGVHGPKRLIVVLYD